jgi:hypothetical protein
VPFYFGSVNAASEFARGCIDEIAIWSRSFTAGEIAASWNLPLSGDENGLVGYWKFDDGTADDSTANGHHGALLAGAGTQAEEIPGFGAPTLRQALEEPGAYLLEGAVEGVDYFVDAYFDLNGNDALDSGEWCGQYPDSPFELAGDIVAIDIDLYDPATVWLSINRSGNDVVLSWPDWATGTILTTSPDLATGPWDEAEGEITTEDGVRSQSLNPTGPDEFFRLEKR